MSTVIWSGIWNEDTAYTAESLVLHNGTLYKCISAHQSKSPFDAQKWQNTKEGVEMKGAWSAGTYYKINDLVTEDGKVYICTNAHTASSNFSNTSANWSAVASGPARIQIEN